MRRGQRADLHGTTFAAASALPRGRTIAVRSKDGTELHTEVFGRRDGYPIVLAHGITCAIRVWAYQIADLAEDYRVIAFDHRGHGRSGVPSRRGNYSLDHLAA
ncbi:MAG: alpha/beta fold hydrolase, partial [Mycobacterium sp.]